MSILRLRFDVWGVEETVPEYGVVANIYDVSGRPGKGEGVRDLVIPAGALTDSETFAEVSLEPGRYIVEAVPPSGRLVSEEVVVEEHGGPQEVRLFVGQSPREWLGWQHFAGNVEQRPETYHHRVTIQKAHTAPEIRAEVISSVSPPVRGTAAAELSTPGALVARGYFGDIDGVGKIDARASLSELLPLAEADPPASVSSLQPMPYSGDEVSQMYSTAELIPPHFGPDDYREDRFQRHYLFVRGEGTTPQYCVLPVPWEQQPDIGGMATVEALVTTPPIGSPAPPGSDTGYRASILVRDQVLGSVIGYLATGELTSAATIMKQVSDKPMATDMLYYKVANPIAAAAGAYVLLGGRWSGQKERWHDWVHNLSRWFRWLPDGAILYGWLAMNRRYGKENLAEARASFLEGYRRGLPFYSKGVSMLLDGLTLLANQTRAAGESDPEVGAALHSVRRLGMRTNRRSPFTMVMLK